MDSIFFGSFVIFAIVALILHIVSSKRGAYELVFEDAETGLKFKRLRRTFFSAYFLALLGDWLQGPYVYNLYEYYGFGEFQIALLYLVGFASSVFFGTFTGSIADFWGRKCVSSAYCLLYIACCLTKLSSNFFVLLIGRIFGGIATSILFSAFESWYVYKHNDDDQKYPSEWAGDTFSIATFFNGLLAILAGVIANFFAETLGYGPVAPFILAIVPLALCFGVISIYWSENYGAHNDGGKISESYVEGLKIILSKPRIFFLGCIQSSVESVMYIFIFLWTPILSPLRPPLGIIFAGFMTCVMIGSKTFSILVNKYGFSYARVINVALWILTISLLVSICSLHPYFSDLKYLVTFFAFAMMEVAFGIYFPAISFLKSQLIPESHRANIMNWFRVPLNIITCIALLSLKSKTVEKDKRIVLFVCLLIVVIGKLFIGKISNANENSTKSPNNKVIVEA